MYIYRLRFARLMHLRFNLDDVLEIVKLENHKINFPFLRLEVINLTPKLKK